MNTTTGREGMERADRIRTALRYLIVKTNGNLSHGDMSRLAEHFGVTRERVRQLKADELDKWQRQQLCVKPLTQLLPSDTPLGVERRG